MIIMNYEEEIQSKQKWTILYFYGSYGLFYVIAIIYRMYLPVITWNFWIAELNKQAEYAFDLAEIMDLILLGILFSVNAMHTFNLFEEFLSKKRKLFKYPFIIGVVIVNFGVISHMVANQLHDYIYQMEDTGIEIESGSLLEKLSLGLYFWDEIVSHILTGLGFFILLFLFFRLERVNTLEIHCRTGSLRYLGFLVGLGYAYGMIEGQAGVIFFILSVALLIFVLVNMIGSKFKYKPFNTVTIYFLLGYIVFTVIYVYITGLKPNYPYIYQFSELNLSFL